MTHAVLTQEESRDLAMRWQESVKAGRPDYEARNALVMGNLGLAGKEATRRAQRCAIDSDHLLQVAVFGLMGAADAYNALRDPPVRFSTYATWKCRGAISREILIWKRRNRVPTPFTDAGIRKTPDIPDTHAEPRPINTESVEKIRDALAVLRPQHRYVVARCRGLDGHEETTLEALGKELGLTKQRVGQIRIAAEGLMTRYLAKGKRR